MICSSGRSTTSILMSLWMPESEMGLRAKAKWGLTPVSVQAQVSRPSGLCFIGVRIKAKRNGYFLACHWETLAPRPPEYGHEQEGPIQFQWVTRRSILSGDSFFWKTVTICPVAKHPRSRAHLSTYHPHTDETAKVSGTFFQRCDFFQSAGSSARARSITCCIERCWLTCRRFSLCAIKQRPKTQW